MPASTVKICDLTLSGVRASDLRPSRKPTSVTASINRKKLQLMTTSLVL